MSRSYADSMSSFLILRSCISESCFLTVSLRFFTSFCNSFMLLLSLISFLILSSSATICACNYEFSILRFSASVILFCNSVYNPDTSPSLPLLFILYPFNSSFKRLNARTYSSLCAILSRSNYSLSYLIVICCSWMNLSFSSTIGAIMRMSFSS